MNYPRSIEKNLLAWPTVTWRVYLLVVGSLFCGVGTECLLLAAPCHCLQEAKSSALLIVSGPVGEKNARSTLVTAESSAVPTGVKEAGKNEKSREPQTDPEPPAFFLRPYRVLVSVSFANQPYLSSAWRERYQLELANEIKRKIGDLWQVDMQENRLFPVGDQIGFKQLKMQVESLQKKISTKALINNEPAKLTDLDRLFPEDYDKIFYVTIKREQGRYELCGCEWDTLLRNLSPVVVEQVFVKEWLAEKMVGFLWNVFRPLAELEDLRFNQVGFQIRGGQFPPADPTYSLARSGEYWLAFNVYLDRKKEVQRVQTLKWTYLKVNEVERSRFKGEVFSATRSPIAKKRRRVRVIGLLARSYFEKTAYQFRAQRGAKAALGGYRVRLIPFFESEPAPEKIQNKWTDQLGRLSISADTHLEPQKLQVFADKILLAQLPILPGLYAEERLDVPENAQRIATIGELQRLETDLIENITVRMVLIARAKLLAKEGKADEVKDLIDEFKKLPGQEDFLTRISNTKIKQKEAAQAINDRRQMARIDLLCKDADELVRKLLAYDKVNKQLAEMKALVVSF